MLMPATVVPAVEFPARSVARSLVTLWLAPSPLSSLLVGQEATPEPSLPSASLGSEQVKSTVTSVRYQPAELGVAVGPPVITGPVRSILMPVTDAGALVLPALSRTVTGPAPR